MPHRVRIRLLPASRQAAHALQPQAIASPLWHTRAAIPHHQQGLQPRHWPHQRRLSPAPPLSSSPYQQSRSFHYDPHSTYNAYATPKPSLRSRLGHILLGGVLTVGGYITWEYLAFRAALAELKAEVVEKERELEHFDSLRAAFAEARRAGDHVRLRGLTFEMARHMDALDAVEEDANGGVSVSVSVGGGEGEGSTSSSSLSVGGSGLERVEAGVLPGLAFDDPMSGRELVAPEDTRMYVHQDAAGRVYFLMVGVNADLDDVYRGLADPVPEREHDKLGELFRRVADQVRMWERQGRVGDLADPVSGGRGRGKGGKLHFIVGFVFRDQHWAFDYSGGHWDVWDGPTKLLDEEWMHKVEDAFAKLH